MLDIMTQAENAIQTYNSALAIHSANIANMSVPGYKKLTVSFESIFEKILNQGTPASSFSNIGGTNPVQFGQGVAVSNVAVDMSAGSTAQGDPIDLAINGRGLFIVSADGGHSYQYTRAGKFQISASGSLMTAAGMQVYGLSSGGSLVPITGLTGALANYSWDNSGNLLLNGNSTGYQIALTFFQNDSGLAQASGTTFTETLASGPAASAQASGGAAGTTLPGTVEQSNVFYLGETIDSLEIQRAMSGNLTVVRMASDIISSFISKLG
ncbi:MAG: flagellar hook-basal body complex protein [Candidatus Margulisiibacteriota bacterium]